MTMWDDVKRNLLGWYDTASDKTGEVARIGLKRYDIFGISRDVERQFSEIGSLIYTGLKEGRDDMLSDEALLAIVARVTALEEELSAKEDDIADIKAAKAAQREAARQAQEEPEPVPEADPEMDSDYEPVSESLAEDPVETPLETADEDPKKPGGGE